MSSGVMVGVMTSTASAADIDWKTTRPSVEPISGSVARSGCGIMPITLRSRLRMPAMSRSGAVGVVEVAEGDAVFGFQLVERALVGDSSSLRRERWAGAAIWPFCAPQVKGELVVSTRRRHVAADEFQAAIADAARRAAVRLPPGSGSRCRCRARGRHRRRTCVTACMTGENLAMAPQRR